MSTKPVEAFKIMSVAGAYWRGNEKIKYYNVYMLQLSLKSAASRAS